MNYYTVQVKTGSEKKFLRLADRKLADTAGDEVPVGRLIWPRRKMIIRKKSRSLESLAPIFPGYIFYEAETIETPVYWALRKCDGFFRFLPDNHNITPLGGNDRELLLHFLSYGEVVETSEVIFDENQRIQVVHGPLKGLEGRIVKVDKRKGRAKVQLVMYAKTHLIDFGFRNLVPAGTQS